MFRMWRTGAAFALDLDTRALIRERHSGQISQRNPREKWLQLISTQIEMRRSFEEMHVLDKFSFIQCQQSIFDRIRILARYDRHEAIRLLYITGTSNLINFIRFQVRTTAKFTWHYSI